MATARARAPKKLDWLQPAILCGSLVPFAVLFWKAGSGRLGANPIATALNQLGLLALLFLLASLACTPLKIVFGWKWPLKLRKTLGLLGFWTVFAHFLLYAVVDQQLMLRMIVEDVITRPFIGLGFLGLMLLVPLAWTSNKLQLKRLGPKRWQRLHRLAYAVAVLGILHFLLRVKSATGEPLIYGGVLALLLGIRAVDAIRRRLRA